jgi:2-amino-4-hydroxy-6-hydroxymethyldihydropteridine diphosphokinase
VKSGCRLSSETYVGLGANLGNPRKTFEEALGLISSFAEVVAGSRLYRSAPFGFPDQPDFVNAVAKLKTDLEALALLRELRTVEQALGKKVIRENGPRIIDLDLLVHGDHVIDSEELILPHPGIAERDFVLLPLCDLAPEILHPVLRKSFKELKASLADQHVIGTPEDWSFDLFSDTSE